jgi:hypothetical protein
MKMKVGMYPDYLPTYHLELLLPSILGTPILSQPFQHVCRQMTYQVNYLVNGC